VQIDFDTIGMSRGRLVRELAKHGVGTQVHYIPVYRQPYYAERYGDLHLPGAEAYYASCLSLPLFADMTPDDAARVVSALAEITGLQS
jgi:dTDP-4-amino-4,6-dideoxygalactose transaminase